jgi:hypothetical protein
VIVGEVVALRERLRWFDESVDDFARETRASALSGAVETSRGT